MTKILLINPPIEGDIHSGILNIKVPLGLAYIAGYLEKYGYKPKILDCMAYYENVKKTDKGYRIGLPDEKIVEKIKKFKPDIIGLTCTFTAYEKDSFRIADLIKKTDEKIVVVSGGAHSSANPSSVLKNKNIDFVIIGEGEETFLEIVKNIQNNKKLEKINGTGIKLKGKIKINNPRELIKNLDDIPFPARHLLPMERYFKHPENSVSTMREPTTEIVSSRGCPFNCLFCSIKTVWGRGWRGRSAKNVVDEIEHLHEKYKVKEFRFFDDNLTWNKKRIMGICDEIIKRKLNIKWDTPNGVALTTLDEEILKKMKESGYYRVVIAIESGNEEILRFIRKPLTLKKAKEIIKICNKLGIWIWSPFIFGFPDENLKSVRKTIYFAKKCGINFATFYVAQPYAGTELYDVFKEKGLLDEGLQKRSTLIHTQYDTLHFKADELTKIQTKAYEEFIRYKFISYLNPITFYKQFLNRIRSFEDLKFVIKMFSKVIKKEYLNDESRIDKKEKVPHRNNFLRKIEINFKEFIFSEKNKERDILKGLCVGKGADIGCGSNKVSEECIGVDLSGKGEKGKYGNQKGEVSEADYQSNGDNLKMFKDNELNFLVAKHNLEHYENPKKTLKEWKRVLKKGGKVGVVVPDDKYVDSDKLDLDHKSKFTLESLGELFEKTGFKIIEKGFATKHWSIYLIAEK